MFHPKRFGAAVLVAVAVLTAVVLDGSPASATTAHGGPATPANMSSHPWSYDGCSNAPDRGPGFDFHHACIHHDGCYRGHWARRSTCDGWFLRSLRASCQVLHTSAWGRWPCYGVAAAYFAAVRAWGSSAYADHSVATPVR